ncbi:glycerol-3-phosphate acyltransferase [Marinobacter segnicrescens]|uniref:Glycerol-3-phosphate acyltransferase n=1 Tax=Marinobacter segnicrescens TaxID=430453 RepID=A0A1I0F0X8_9GAMM|nr:MULTISPECIES: glycerol-3-phosphate 1-O-acyltransferase PlsB [Marinobacter]UZD64776.1 glycerol-3-phosphate 1-O-acyltransferase PlsB [Marinobacter sp. AN1]SET50653.1 glycerol-3-phosphate acyltransferase [Marinobacter segnicrescens]
MRLFPAVSGAITTLLRKVLFLWVRTDVLGAGKDELKLDPERPVCYVMQYSSLSSRLVLEQEVARAGLPSASAPMAVHGGLNHSFCFLYRRARSSFSPRLTPVMTPQMEQLVNLSVEDPTLDIQLVPVSLFWGRSPDKEKSVLKLLLSDTWSVAGRFQKFLIILLHGRNTLVRFGEPMSLADIVREHHRSKARANRKTARLLRTHFRRVRQAVLGPDLSHRRTLVADLIRTPAVREAIRETARREDEHPDKVRARAYEYANEIASSMSIATIRILEVLLSWLWNRIYNGIRINNIREVQEVAEENAVVYVPCHRSHIDYLLLSYVLYRNGLMPPHIAAGINLNMPVVGPILRRGGAFFMRRSFRDNPLYSAVFNEYMHVMFTRGYSVEYFVEGGRSRTGRTLQPRPGMLSMTVRSFLRDHKKPIVLVPVYIGYEKVMEGRSYLGELRGKKKKQESVVGLAKTARKLRSSFGKVSVNFGEAIFLDEALEQARPGWKHEAVGAEARPAWLPDAVDHLARHVTTGINSAAAVNPVNLVATLLLATERLAMDERQLAAMMDHYLSLLKTHTYAETVTFPEGDGMEWIRYCETMGLVGRYPQKLGDIIGLDGTNATLMTYYRNNIQHLFALPALIACLFENCTSMARDKVIFLASAIYPYLHSELFLRYDPETVGVEVDRWIGTLSDHGILRADGDRVMGPEEGTDARLQLHTLSRFIIQTLERYYIVIATLRKHGPGVLTAEELEEESALMAERMSLLFGLNAPEFFDKTLFRNFIGELAGNGVIVAGEDDRLSYTRELEEVSEDARLVLSVEKRQAIAQVTQLNRPE